MATAKEYSITELRDLLQKSDKKINSLMESYLSTGASSPEMKEDIQKHIALRSKARGMYARLLKHTHIGSLHTFSHARCVECGWYGHIYENISVEPGDYKILVGGKFHYIDNSNPDVESHQFKYDNVNPDSETEMLEHAEQSHGGNPIRVEVSSVAPADVNPAQIAMSSPQFWQGLRNWKQVSNIKQS